MPRLPQFKALMPDVDVKIITSQSMPSASGDHADVAIVFGDTHADWGARERGEAVSRARHARVQPGAYRGEPVTVRARRSARSCRCCISSRR